MKKFDTIVIGGGASGMMSAFVAAENGLSVLIIEKNKELGKKLSITGGGRCNIMNAEFNIRKLLKNYGKKSKFLFSPFSQFGTKETWDFFEKRGLPLMIEAGNRTFPKSQSALSVVKFFRKLLSKNNVTILNNTAVKKINVSNGKIISIESKDRTFFAKNFIIATGGLSHPETGSTGDGFKFLRKLGHTIHEANPNLVPLKVRETWIEKVSGKSLSFMKITFHLNNKKSFSRTGKILFTHFGLSGPLILNSSSEVSKLLKEGLVTSSIDMFPDTDEGSLDKKILNTFTKNKNKILKNILPEIIPHGMLPIFEELLNESLLTKAVHSITVEERKEIRDVLKNFTLEIDKAMGMDRAIVSDGGIPLEEIDTKTMKSKIIDNLFITGDMLDINRPSGGFSLQLCWTSGYVAGLSGSEKI